MNGHFTFIGYAPPPEAPREEQPPAPPSPFDLSEGLPELPVGYGDDHVAALPRDPRTLWTYWDLHPETVERAREGLGDPAAVLRLFRDGEEIRRVDVALESRSFYLRDLAPGRAYRVEVCWIAGSQVRVIAASREVRLPPEGPSPRVADRFLRLPPDVPLAGLDLGSLEVKPPESPDRREEISGGLPAGYPMPSSR